MPDFAFALAVAATISAGLLAARPVAARFLRPAQIVHEWEQGLLYVDGRFKQVLGPGRYRTGGWREHLVVTLPSVERVEPIGPIDVTSMDNLSFRLSCAVAYTIEDPRAAHEGTYHQILRLAASEALVRLSAERILETVLAERASLDAAATAAITRPVPGCAIASVTVTSVALPPELRRLYAEIERARLEGQAALERARGEQASLRSLANAARMLKGNPELMNLRLLQALASGGSKGATLVMGRDAFAMEAARGGAAGQGG